MRLPSAAILSLLLLTGCEEKKPTPNEPGAKRPSTSSGRAQRTGKPAKAQTGLPIDTARQTLQSLMDKGVDPGERADAVATLAASYAKEDPKGALEWLQSLEDPEDRAAAWPALILGLGESAPGVGLGVYGKLNDPAQRQEYLDALISGEVISSNPDLAWSHLQSAAPRGIERNELEDKLLKIQADLNPEKAWEAYQKHSSEPSEASFIKKFPLAEENNAPPGTGPKFPINVIAEIHDPARQAGTVALALEKLDSPGRQVVINWLSDQPQNPRFDSTYSNLALLHAGGDATIARMWAERITDESRRESTLKDIEAKEAQEAAQQ